MSAPAATQAAIERALAAAKAQGLAISGFSVSRDGTVTINTASPPPEAVDKPAGNVAPMKARKWAR